VSRIG